jgi:hypothetical protein
MADLSTTENAERYCHCGTHADAMAVAEKLLTDMIAHDCPVWAFQIGAALRTMAIDILKNEGMTVAECKALGDDLTRITRRDMKAASALLEAGIKRRTELGT